MTRNRKSRIKVREWNSYIDTSDCKYSLRKEEGGLKSRGREKRQNGAAKIKKKN